MVQQMRAIVLFVRDLPGCTAFYRDTFKLPYLGSDDVSGTFLLEDGLYLILLSPTETADLLGTTVDALQSAGGPRGLLAAGVADVDAAYTELSAQGVRFLRPPTDQPWGLRTAHFADPEGHIWEINQPVKPRPAEEAAAQAV